ncbi:uncharacterized protein PITG_01334 [Phytophthora infestans T30-4]|uniref:Uncharacterized protein n=1 Tax=Phytophthora infestans (strain T30-4) TaxID=403677 RepID=D0MV91_PHYIT|nr:uncharacterized protein PITG_01334 [Phytophthora infestans T30-4]EEY61087.1 hypothetical protein PITG_01334 [Phytophthora infestans T30-4]|eukprot:XP_002908004.1 hypothetical protein PITG_01334 [Phytophthora infestans T30-4]
MNTLCILSSNAVHPVKAIEVRMAFIQSRVAHARALHTKRLRSTPRTHCTTASRNLKSGILAHTHFRHVGRSALHQLLESQKHQARL